MSFVSGMRRDASSALRLLRRQWRYGLLVTLTMAVGIGATTVMFSRPMAF
jgi:hypothetical protein